MFEYLLENDLISRNQSGFKPGDSSINSCDLLHMRFINLLIKAMKLNGQYSSWAAIEAGALQGSILGPSFFLIYIKNLSDDLASNEKLFADDTSLFYVVEVMTKSANELNNDLTKISTWALQWKMSLNSFMTEIVII